MESIILLKNEIYDLVESLYFTPIEVNTLIFIPWLILAIIFSIPFFALEYLIFGKIMEKSSRNFESEGGGLGAMIFAPLSFIVIIISLYIPFSIGGSIAAAIIKKIIEVTPAVTAFLHTNAVLIIIITVLVAVLAGTVIFIIKKKK